MKNSRTAALIWLVTASTWLVACERDRETKPRLPRGLNVAFVELRPGPEETTQVVVALSNETAAEKRLADLRRQVVVRDASDGEHALHPISLGVDKPIIVPAKSTITVPLLFDGAFAEVGHLTFQGADVAVSSRVE